MKKVSLVLATLILGASSAWANTNASAMPRNRVSADPHYAQQAAKPTCNHLNTAGLFENTNPPKSNSTRKGGTVNGRE